MQVAVPIKGQPAAPRVQVPRYKALAKLERESQQKLEDLVALYDRRLELISEDVRAEAMQLLRSPAQRAILNALEVRTPEIDEDFGYEWADALAEMNADPARSSATDLFMARMPELDALLKDPAVRQRNEVEWLYDQTVGRFDKFTPYLALEEQELQRWKEQCPAAYGIAEFTARRLAQRTQDNTRPSPQGPAALSDEGREMSFLAHMIASRKLYMAATDVSEFYEGPSTFVDVSVPAHLHRVFDTKIYVRLGTKTKPFAYREASPAQLTNFREMIGQQSQMLNNLQEKVMPWTSRKGMGQKIDSNLMAQVYFGVVRGGHPSNGQFHGPTLEKLNGNQDRYHMLGFREDLAPEQAAVFERKLTTDSGLREFLDRPSVQQEFRRNRVDKSLVEMSLNAEVDQVLLDEVRAWNPAVPVAGGGLAERARSVLPAVFKDVVACHTALLESDYVSVRQAPFFKSRLEQSYEQGLPQKERAKRESFYRPVAVVLIAKRDGYEGPLPEGWKALESYTDPVTGGEFTDYRLETPAGTGLVSLIKGGNPEAGKQAVDSLLDAHGAPLINDPKARVKGARVSELFFNELKSSCLHTHSIARTQFYTSFSMAESLKFLRGTSEEPTVEMVVEALKPCSIFRYSDEYCRVKPSEMVRVKYRTPTGEAKNPCWDASAALGGLHGDLMLDRLNNPKWSLVLIEGEKKAAMLAQMVQDMRLPYHVIAIPGVWMAMKGPRGKRVLSEFFDKFVMQDARGDHRKCLVFFDNDKAYNVNVTQAMVETAACMQAKGGDVFIPNLPFGKKIKGADDFAQAHCRKESGIDYRPLVKIIEGAVYVPVKSYPIKHQTSEQQRQVRRYLCEAEQIHELQQAVRKSADPIRSKELRKLVVLQGPYALQQSAELRQMVSLQAPAAPAAPRSMERQILEALDAMSDSDRKALMQTVLKDNPALRNLQRKMAAHIPNFDTGTTLQEVQVAGANLHRSEASKPDKILLTQDLFALT